MKKVLGEIQYQFFKFRRVEPEIVKNPFVVKCELPTASIVTTPEESISNSFVSILMGLSAFVPICIETAESICICPDASISIIFPEPPVVIVISSLVSMSSVDASLSMRHPNRYQLNLI